MKELRSEFTEEEFSNCITSSLKETTEIASKFDNPGNIQIYSSIGFVDINGTEYQAQITLNPCRAMWAEVEKPKINAIDSVTVCNGSVSAISLKISS